MLTLAFLLVASVYAAESVDESEPLADIVEEGPSRYERALRRFVRESRERGDQESLAASVPVTDLELLHGESRNWAVFALGKAALDEGRVMEGGRLLAQVERDDPLRPHALAILAELAWNGDRTTSIRYYRELLDIHAEPGVPGLETLDSLKTVAIQKLIEDAPNRVEEQPVLALAD